MGFRHSILEVSPPFLLGPIGEANQVAAGEVLDALGDWAIEGVMASMPGYGPNDALYLIGRDMQIARGPNETDDHYINRLQGAVASHRIRGNGGELLRQLLAWFSPSTATPVRIVSNRAVWHEIDLVTEVVTKTDVGTNWEWDAFASVRWWRGWVIIDSSAAPWTIDRWGDPGDWGDGGSWGSDADPSDGEALRRIVEKWKPARMVCKNIIVTFDASLFERTDASPPNPNGNGEDSAWRASLDAAFWRGAT